MERRIALTPSEAIAAVIVAGIVVVMIVFSIASAGSSSPCTDERALLRDAVAAFRADHGTGSEPTMRQLVENGDLFRESSRYAIEYRGASRELTLTPVAGGGC